MTVEMAPGAEDVIGRVRERELTLSMRPGKLEGVARLAHRVEADGVPGVFVEAGVAMGGSAIVLCHTKSTDRVLYLYDVFELAPAPGPADDERSHDDHRELLGGTAATGSVANYYAHRDDLLGYVRRNLADAGVDLSGDHVRFVRGLYEDTFHPAGPVAFAHVDCDWYDPVRICIERVADLVSPGGIVLFDDYGTYGGCRTAVDDWLARDDRFRIVHHERTLGVQRTP